MKRTFECRKDLWHDAAIPSLKVETKLNMLLQTNSYIVPKDKRAEHARLLQRFRQTLARLGCEHFEAYEQVGANWSGNETTGRFVQLMRFKDRKQQQSVQAAERSDPAAQALIKEFCELINFPYQQQQGLFAVGFYHGIMPLNSPLRQPPAAEPDATPALPTNENGVPLPPPPLPPHDVHPPDIHGEDNSISRPGQSLSGESLGGESLGGQALSGKSLSGGPGLSSPDTPENPEAADDAAGHDDAESDPQSLGAERSH